jgi:hypothetical protein
MPQELSRDARQVMDQLRVAYLAQGCPSRRDWWFSIPAKIADELMGFGFIESVDLDQWTLTNAGHAWVMTS